MAKATAGRAFEAGVKAALELFKDLDWSSLRRQLAASAETVLRSLKKAKKR